MQEVTSDQCFFKVQYLCMSRQEGGAGRETEIRREHVFSLVPNQKIILVSRGNIIKILLPLRVHRLYLDLPEIKSI